MGVRARGANHRLLGWSLLRSVPGGRFTAGRIGLGLAFRKGHREQVEEGRARPEARRYSGLERRSRFPQGRPGSYFSGYDHHKKHHVEHQSPTGEYNYTDYAEKMDVAT